MLVVAANLLEAESAVKVEEREKYLAEKCPPLELPYSRDELMVSPDLTVDRDNTSESCGGSVVEATPSKRVSACQELCKELHQQIGVSEEERYGIEFKLNMVLNEVSNTVLRSSTAAHIFICLVLNDAQGTRPEHKDRRFEGKVQKTTSEEGAYVR